MTEHADVIFVYTFVSSSFLHVYAYMLKCLKYCVKCLYAFVSWTGTSLL